MGFLDVLKDTVDTTINTASKMAGDRSNGSSAKSNNGQKSSNGGSKKK
jgi:hypothetical protein